MHMRSNMYEFSNRHKCNHQRGIFFAFLAQITALSPRHFLPCFTQHSPTTSASQKLLCQSLFSLTSTRGKWVFMAPSREVPEFPVYSVPRSPHPHPAFDSFHLSSTSLLNLTLQVALCDFTLRAMVKWILSRSVPRAHRHNRADVFRVVYIRNERCRSLSTQMGTVGFRLGRRKTEANQVPSY